MALVVTLCQAQGTVSARDEDAGTVEARVMRAIEAAVSMRMGTAVDVAVTAVEGVRLESDAQTLVATPDPPARTGVPSRFTLTASAGNARRRVGEATVVVTVHADVLRAQRAIERGEVLRAGDVAATRDELKGAAFKSPPTVADAIGARVSRDLGRGAAVTAADLMVQPTVRAGEPVTARMHAGGFEIDAAAVAMDSGAQGETIRVVNVSSRRVIRARIAGARLVEVLDR